MPQARDEAGNIWEVDAQGNPVRLIRAAGSQSVPGGVQIKAADPTRQYEAPKAAADATIAGNKAAASGLDPALAAEELRGKRLANDKTAKELAQGNNGKGLTPEVRQNAIAGYSMAQQLRGLVKEIQDLDTAGPGGTKGLRGLRDYLPTQDNTRLDNAANAARGLISSALGFTASQNNTEKESERNVGPYLPSAWDRDQARLDKIKRLSELADLAEKRSVAILGGIPDENGNITPVQTNRPGGLPASTIEASGPGIAVPDPSGDRQTVTQNDRMYVAEAQRAFNEGATREQMDAIAAKYGAGPFGPDLDKAIKGRDTTGARTSFTTPASGREDGGFAGGALGGAAASPGGVAYQNFANAILPVGIFNPSSLEKFQAANEREPEAALAGSIIGGIPAVAGLELAAARALPSLSALNASRIADAAYGTYQGAGNADEGNGLMGGAIGGISGLLGGEAGRRLMGGVGAAARGIADPSVRYLRGQGVAMTGGQALGGTAKQVEDQLTGYPVIGGIIGNRREEGMVDWNRAMFRQAGEGAPIANIGERGAEELDDVVRRAYAPLDAVTMTADAPLMSDLAAAASRGQSIPGRADDFNYVVNTRVRPNFDGSGGMTGRNYQDSVRNLRIAGNNQGLAAMHPDDFSGALAGVEDALTGMVYRQAPEAIDALEQGNRIYRNQSIVDQAIKAARNARGPDGDALVMPSQLNAASVSNTNRFGGASRAATTDRPFYELATAGQDVLPSRVGDSGTAGRLALLSAAGLAGGGGAALGGSDDGGVVGAGVGGVGGLATLAGLAALGGSRNGQRAILSALMDRPAAVERIGDYVYNRRALGGAFGAPALIGGVNVLGLGQ